MNTPPPPPPPNERSSYGPGDNMKTGFRKVLFTKTIRVILDGPDGWPRQRNTSH